MVNQEPQSAGTPGTGDNAGLSASHSGRVVRQFRQVLLWPLELTLFQHEAQIRRRHWDLLTANPGVKSLWTEVNDEFPIDPGSLQERHYREFATFLPHVQRLLYRAPDTRSGGSEYK